jgi:hypothetical protein
MILQWLLAHLNWPLVPPTNAGSSAFRLSCTVATCLPDRSEHDCITVDISPGGARLRAPAAGKINDRVVAYLETIGRIEGVIARQTDDGFAMTITATIPPPRQAGGAADLAGQPRRTRPAGRPPPRALHSAQPAWPPRHQPRAAN